MQLIPSSFILNCVQVVQKELKSREIKLELKFYPSDEWGTPNKVPIIAVPVSYYYPLFRPIEDDHIRLSKKAVIRILHHEAGHCVLYAFELFKEQKFAGIFGDFYTPYPDNGYINNFKPVLVEKEFVKHLPDCNWGYPAIHPDEDFAETFAVWLEQDKESWTKEYAEGKALDKLLLMDQLMTEIRNIEPLVTKGKRDKPFHSVIFK